MRPLVLLVLVIFLSSGCIFQKDDNLPPKYVTENIPEEFWTIFAEGNAKIYVKQGDELTITYNKNSSLEYYLDVGNLVITKAQDSILITVKNIDTLDYFKVLDTIKLYVLDTIDKPALGKIDMEMDNDAYMELTVNNCQMLSPNLKGNSVLVIKGSYNQQLNLLMGDDAVFNGLDFYLTNGAFVELHQNSIAEVYLNDNSILEGYLYDDALLKIKGHPYVDVKVNGNARYVMLEK